MADVNVQRAVVWSRFTIENCRGDFVARQNPASRPDQQIEDVEFHRRQVNQFTSLPHFSSLRVDLKLAGDLSRSLHRQLSGSP